MNKELSIVVPVCNEEENILPLVQEVRRAFRDSGVDYEVVFVDDGSTDGTWSKVATARLTDPRVRGIRHQKNAGQSAALWTGIQATTSPLLATLDGDLQNDPADLPRLFALLPEHDFVCGVRTQRQDSFVRRVSSRIARQARKAVLGVDFCDTGCAVRVFKREILKSIFPFNGLHRFLPVLVHGAGAKIKEVPIRHRARMAGSSKYGLNNRLWRGIFDLFAMAWYQKRRIAEVPCIELSPRSAPAGAAAAPAELSSSLKPALA